MTEPINPATLSDPRDLAAYWHTRLQSEDLTEQERVSFEQWRQAEPEHARQYQRVLDIWALADALPRDEVEKLGRAAPAPRQAAQAGHTGPPPRRARPAHTTRPAWHYGLGLACGAAIALVLVDPIDRWVVPGYQAEFVTAHGERRQVVLPDASVITLNTDTVATVRYFSHSRTVHLSRGEALFQVDGTRGEPFAVDVDSGSVLVTGTRFNVRREAQTFSVGVLEGSVEVRTGPWWQRQVAMLWPGNAAHATARGIGVQTQADVESTVAWREGKMVFRGAQLAEAVREVNRYGKHRIELADPATGQLRISGVFSIDDASAFVAALPKIIPVTTRTRSDGQVDILPR